jgi:predicted nucleic acid-binding protein
MRSCYQRFGAVYIPPAVLAELSHGDAPEAVHAWLRTNPAWLVMKPPAVVDPTLSLDRGESEAISLAMELGAQVLIDEKVGREAAAGRGLQVAGTLAVLGLAAERKLIDLTAEIEKLRATKFRASEALYRSFLGGPPRD